MGNTPGIKSEVKRGMTRKKTSEPNFQEMFTFLVCHILVRKRVLQLYVCMFCFTVQVKDRISLLNSIVRVSLWHDPLIADRIFLGQVNLSIGTLKFPMSHDGWYWLCSRPLPPGQANKADLGALRVKVHYSQDLIYPLQVYDPLRHLLLRGLDSPVSSSYEHYTIFMSVACVQDIYCSEALTVSPASM